jgi:hypothetical protein
MVIYKIFVFGADRKSNMAASALLPFDYIDYKRLSENKCFPNHRWYSDATWGENGRMVSIGLVVSNKKILKMVTTTSIQDGCHEQT